MPLKYRDNLTVPDVLCIRWSRKGRSLFTEETCYGCVAFGCGNGACRVKNCLLTATSRLRRSSYYWRQDIDVILDKGILLVENESRI